MANIYVHARHNVENTHIAVSRNGHAPFMLVRVSELKLDGSALSLQAVQRWLDAKRIVAAPIELERKRSMETPSFNYAVRVRCIAGVEA